MNRPKTCGSTEASPSRHTRFKTGKLFVDIRKQAFLVAASAEATRTQILEEALEKIMQMKLEDGETDYKYAFNRCWHAANEALEQYRNAP